MKATAILFSLCLACFWTHVWAQDPKEIVRKADEHSKGKTSFASMTIQTIRPGWSREMSLKAWTKGNDQMLMLLTAPAREKGVVYLRRGKEVWNWIPSIERTIKMPPSMMGQSWMGTDFTNDDLVKEASILEDYTHQLKGDTTLENRACYKIKLVPKTQAAVVWGLVEMYIDKKDFLILHVNYYDEDGSLVNRMHGSDIKMLGGRLLPSRMEMIPAEKPNNKTVLIYTSIVFDEPIDDSFFSTQNMTRVK